jgi:hypothetical protein
MPDILSVAHEWREFQAAIISGGGRRLPDLDFPAQAHGEVVATGREGESRHGPYQG